MPEDMSSSNDHETILCYETGKRIKVMTDNGMVCGTVTLMDVGISGEAAYTIVTDKTNKIIILNHKQLEAGIKAYGLGSKVVIELSDNNDNDNDNDNSIDSKEKNTTFFIITTTTTTTTVLLPHTYTAPLKKSNNRTIDSCQKTPFRIFAIDSIMV